MAKKKEEVRKITEGELQEVQKYANAMNQIQMQVGRLEVNKADLMNELKVVREGMDEVQKSLMATYGDITINLTDGTITEAEAEDAGNS